MKRLMLILLALALVAGICGCKDDASGAIAELSFSDATSVTAIKALDGKKVTIIGYMATLSPLSGEYMYLMNLPYQNCPFCVPNTTQLSNTMAVYAKRGEKFEFTDQAIRVTGTLNVGSYSDDFGYVYDYRVSDASFEVVDLGEISAEYALWMSLAEDGVVADISAMFDYLYFISQWANIRYSGYNDDGSQYAFYPYPGDVEMLLESSESYGYARFAAEDYFPGLIARVNAISAEGLADLTEIIADAREFEQYALSEFRGGNYTYEESVDKYFLTSDQALYDGFYEIYGRFETWLSKWEL